jgi:glycosyltransferase involved in cell wall biosynthesis
MQTGEPLPLKNGVRKMRTAILADELLERGHSVLWWAGAFEHQQKVMISEKDKNFDIFDRYTIRVLRGCRYQKNVSLARYIDHQIVAIKFRIQANKFPKPDVIVASMPDHLLAYEAARYARKNRIPLIVDIRDLWPDTFLDRFRNIGLYGLGKIALTLDFARLSFLLKCADALVGMSKGILQWGLDKIGKTESLFDKVFYLGYQNNNSRISANAGGSLDVPDWLRGREEQKIFLFIGTFGVSYELELILDAAKCFEKLGKGNICFILAGTGEKFDLISKKAAGLQNVVLPGWIEQKEISVLLGRGYAGLVACRSVRDAMPNKPFEYLSAGLPLISSLEGEMAELVDQHQFGLNYLPGDLEGLCVCIERLVANQGLHDEMSRNASQFFKKYGDVDQIYDDYAKFIEKVAENYRNSNRRI